MASNTLQIVIGLVAALQYRVSDHAEDRLAEREIDLDDVLSSVANAEVVEEYPDTGRGESVLVLQQLSDKSTVHVVWGLAKAGRNVAVLVTVYTPDPDEWSSDWKTRRH